MNERISQQIMNNPGFWNSLSPVKKAVVRAVAELNESETSQMAKDEILMYRSIVDRYEKEVVEPAARLRQEMQGRCLMCHWPNGTHSPECVVPARREERLLVADLVDAVDITIGQIRVANIQFIPRMCFDRLIKARNAANAHWYGKDREKR
jgi:hypothetical protein